MTFLASSSSRIGSISLDPFNMELLGACTTIGGRRSARGGPSARHTDPSTTTGHQIAFGTKDSRDTVDTKTDPGYWVKSSTVSFAFCSSPDTYSASKSGNGDHGSSWLTTLGIRTSEPWANKAMSTPASRSS